ncbi:MAG: hypothetical protein ACLSCY_04790 [Clostridium sp.]
MQKAGKVLQIVSKYVLAFCDTVARCFGHKKGKLHCPKNVMTVGQKKTIRIKNAKGKRIKWSIKKKSIASYKKSGK